MQTLTLQPTVQDGVIMYEDSPLVSVDKFCCFLPKIAGNRNIFAS